ncbi:MAG: hypothetical protein V4684_10015 [Pseudomonadota bacterium]
MKVTTAIGVSAGLFSTLRQQATPQARTGLQAPVRSDDRSRIRSAFRALCRSRPCTSTPGLRVQKPAQDRSALCGLTPKPAIDIPLTADQRVEAAVALALPGLALSDGQLRTALPESLVVQLLQLDERLNAAHAGNDILGRLVAVLSDHARIRDYASQDPGRALAGLAALVDVMLDSIKPGRDGLALNSLVGLDSRLDGSIVALRTICARDFMLAQADPAERADPHAIARIASAAERLVVLEADLAKARVQMLQAFEAAGIARTMGGIAGLKMTPALVCKLRLELGERRARSVGLAIANVYLLQRKITNPDSANPSVPCAPGDPGDSMMSALLLMRIQLTEEAQELDAQTDSGRRRLREITTETGYLDQRIRSLEPESEAGDPSETFGGLGELELTQLGLPSPTHDFIGPETQAQRDSRTRQGICRLAAQGLSGAGQTRDAVGTINAVMQAWLGARGLEQLAEGALAVLSAGKNEDRARQLGQRLAKQACGTGMAQLRMLASIVQEEITPALNWLRVRDVTTVIEMRRQLMGPEVSNALRDAVRAAALQQLGATPLHRFVPAEHAQAVFNTLRSWGIAAEFVAPEIDACLAEEFGPVALERWIADANLPPEHIDEQNTQDAFFKSIDEMKLGTRLKMVAGKRIEVQTGYIPLDPSMVVELNAKAAAGSSTALEIAHIADAGASVFELTFRAGKDLKIGAELWANLAVVKAVGVDLDAMGAAEASFQRLSGVSLRFDSRQALKDALDKLLASTPAAPIGTSALSGATSILPLVETKTGGRVGVGAKVGVDVGVRQVGGDPQARHVGATATLRAMLQRATLRTESTSLNTVESIDKSEHETVVEGSLIAFAGAEFKAGPSVDHVSYSVTSPVAQASVSVASVVKRKLKVLRGRDGAVQAGTERVAQAYLSAGKGLDAAARVGGAPFVRLMKELSVHDQPAAEAILALIGSVQDNELFSVASTLDAAVAEQVSGLYRLARNHRTGKAGAGTAKEGLRRAEQLERQARDLLADEFNYQIDRIALIPTAERLKTLTALNLVLLQKNSYTEERSEFIAMQVKPDLAVTARVRDELRDARATRQRARQFRS